MQTYRRSYSHEYCCQTNVDSVARIPAGESSGFLGQTLTQKLPMLLVDVFASKSRAADEMSSELLEHVCDCKECLLASIAGACGSLTCAQRPNRDGFDLSAGPSLATDPGVFIDLHGSNATLWKAIPDFQPLGSVSPLGEIGEPTQLKIRLKASRRDDDPVRL